MRKLTAQNMTVSNCLLLFVLTTFVFLKNVRAIAWRKVNPLTATASASASSLSPYPSFSLSSSRWKDLRGGALDVALSENDDNDDEDDDDDDLDLDLGNQQSEKRQENKREALNELVALTIRTAAGHTLLEHVVELTVPATRNIVALKQSVRKQLPGKPPVACLHLVLDGKRLTDDTLVSDLLEDDDDEDDDEDDGDVDSPEGEQRDDNSLKQLTLILDTIPPVDPKFITTIEQKLHHMTTHDLLQAFCVNEAALLRNGALMEEEQKALPSKSNSNDNNTDDKSREQPSTSTSTTTPSPSYHLYMELREHANRIRQELEQSLLNTEAARKILADTQPPSAAKYAIEIRGQRIKVPRQGGRTTRIKQQIQKYINVQWGDAMRYCALFLFFGIFGGRTPAARAILLLGAPSVFVLQARPVKLWIKQLLYALLDHPPGILLSLLPAPQQTLLNFDHHDSMKVLYGKNALEMQYEDSPHSTEGPDENIEAQGTIHEDDDEYDDDGDSDEEEDEEE